MDELLQSLLGCCWGRSVALDGDMDACRMQAVQIVVVHDGPMTRDLKLCSYHARVVSDLTDARAVA